MKTASVRMVSWLLVLALTAPLATPAVASQPATTTQTPVSTALTAGNLASDRNEAPAQPADEEPPDEIDAGGNDVGGWLATVLGAAPDLWTGNSSFVYPLELPAGPGGFAPALSLRYSSEAANSITLRHGGAYEVQAGLPGYGWSLDVPSISSSGPNWLERRYFLTLGGKSYEVVEDNGWRTQPESFLHISRTMSHGNLPYGYSDFRVRCGDGAVNIPLHTRDAAGWIVLTPDGSRYQFGAYDGGDIDDQADATGYFRAGQGPCSGDGKWMKVANQWGLVRAEDRNGNSYTVDWTAETRTIEGNDPSVSGYRCGSNPQFAVDLSETLYARSLIPLNMAYGHAAVAFEYETRGDIPPFGEPICENQRQYGLRKLGAIRAERAGQVVRRYALVNAAPAGRRHLELARIELQGADAANTLPAAHSFSYDKLGNDNEVLLERVENGYGGSVAFGYEEKLLDNAPYPNCQNDSQRWAVNARHVADGLGNVTTSVVAYPAHGEVTGECSDENFEFLGFSPVSETLYPVGQSSGAAARVTTSQFHQLADGSWNQADIRKGKQDLQTIGDGSAAVQTTDWLWTAAGNWPRLDQVSLTLDGVAQQTGYSYDAYGNTTHVREYVPTAGGLSLYRTTVTDYGYLLSGGRYIVDRPKAQRVFAGGETGACVRRTEYNYGGGYGASPVAPANLLGQRTPIGSCSDASYVETRYGYANGDGSGGVNGNVTSVVVENGSLDGETRTAFYPPGIDVQSVTQENGVDDLVSSYSYDAYGRLAETIRPNGLRQRLSYDPFGRPCQAERRFIGSNTWTPQTRWAYSDSDGGAAACPDLDFPDGAGGGRLGALRLAVEDAAVAGYHPASGETNSDPLAGGLASFTFYDGLGRPVAEQTERNHASNPWTTRRTGYDALGQPAREWLPYAGGLWDGSAPPANVATTDYQYDPLGRLLVTTLPDGSQSSVGYYPDAAGLRRGQIATDANGHRVLRLYDVLGRLDEVAERGGTAPPYTPYANTRYGYDGLDQLTDVWDHAGNHTEIVYDQAGRKTRMTDPDMGTWHYGYDQAGNLTTQVDALAGATCTYYDRLNRLTQKKFVTGVASPATYTCPASFASYDASFGYDACQNGLGQRCTASNANLSISYSYNSRGLLYGESKSSLPGLPGSYTAYYLYDLLDRPNGVQYPDNDTVTWSYDAGGQPYGLGGGGEALVLSSSYRPWGALDRQRLGNGLALDDDYEEAERLWLTRRQVAALDAQGNLVNPLLDLSYDYDLVGNVLAISDTLASEVHGYLYDQRDRLTEWRLNGAVQQGYTYNEIGNIASFAGVTYSYPAPGQGRPHAVTGTSAGGSFSYDNAGYMASRRDRAGAVNWTYTWRENHKLGQISSSATDDVATFLYGPDDERIKKSSGPAGDTYDTYYLFPFYQVENGCLRADIDCDGDVDVLDIQKVASRWNTAYPPFEQDGVAPITTVDLTLVAEKWLWTGGSNTGQVVKTYSLGGRTVAVKRGGEWTYLFQDHLGSPTLETDYDGNPGFRWKYEPYGTMRGTEWTLPIDRAFTGQVIEPGLGLHDYVARHYAQPLGRWIAPDTIVPDPADPQSLNRYSYVGNRPTVLVDPSGHSACALPHPGLAAGCWVIEKIALYGSQIINLIQQLTIAAPQAPAMVDMATRAGQASQPASSNAGNTADPGGLDPNNWGSKQEQIVRQSLARDYQQVYGASDAEIRQGLGIQGKVADFVGYNSQQGRWLIAESKGSDMYKAVEQLQNTMQGVLNKTGATTANVDLRIYTNTQSYQRLLTTTPVQGGWTVQNGVLGWWGEANQFVPMIINGVQVLVNVVN
jgi:RHS repeat-associated protein